MNDRIRHTIVCHPLREAALRAAVAALELSPTSHGLDVGCGIGLVTVLLAEAIGAAARVTGLDLSPELLQHGEKYARDAGCTDRVSFRTGDVLDLPFADDAFDWAWSTDCVGYPALRPARALAEMARVVRQEGTVAILMWSSQRLLPGFPILEAKLDATAAGIAPHSRSGNPQDHTLRALGWFQEAHLARPCARTFAGEAHAPLSAPLRAALECLLQMRWQGVEAELAEEDRRLYRRLCLPDSPGFILNLPDYYAFFTYSMFSGKVRF